MGAGGCLSPDLGNDENMRIVYFLLLFVALLGLAARTALGNTWRVELDGSGDFDDIQPAVDAAADGDTILIGPGRFDTFHPCVAPAWTEPTIVWVTKDDLTFIGSGQDVTIIGTESYYGPDWQEPKCFCVIDGKRGAIEDLTIENVDAGVYWYGGYLAMRNCTVRGSHSSLDGMILWTDGGGLIENCRFDVGGNAIASVIFGPSRNILFKDCVFEGNSYGINVNQGATDIDIDGCRFDNGNKGASYNSSSTGSVRNSIFNNSIQKALYVAINSVVTCSDLRIVGGANGVDVRAGSVLTADRIVIEGTTEIAVAFSNQSQVTINNSDILPASGWAVMAWAFSMGPMFGDFTNNYWGTTDSAVIDAMIQDVNDDPDIHCTVNYSPFAQMAVPTESTSWGDLKAMYR